MIRSTRAARTSLLWGPLDGEEVEVVGAPEELVLAFPVGVKKPRGAVYRRKAVGFVDEPLKANRWDVRYVFEGWRVSP